MLLPFSRVLYSLAQTTADDLSIRQLANFSESTGLDVAASRNLELRPFSGGQPSDVTSGEQMEATAFLALRVPDPLLPPLDSNRPLFFGRGH